MNKRIIVYSHGFGVRKDDRGLFTDIAAVMPDLEHVMFDYNKADDNQNSLTVSSLTEQTATLEKVLSEVVSKQPDTKIDLICHSQGCVVAAMLKPKGISKTIFLAPPAHFLGTEAKLEQMSERPGTVIKDGVATYPRRDGSTTIIPADYWKSREGVVPITLYNEFAKSTQLTIINAEQDEVLGNTDFSRLSTDIKVLALPANHDFTGDTRQILTSTIKDLLE
jgi:hypothetical protein